MLISTDVDKIITTLREKKRIQLDDLARKLDMPKSDVRKWAGVLEAQGMIKISHHLTREYLIWTNSDDATGSNYRGEEKKEIVYAPANSLQDLSIIESAQSTAKANVLKNIVNEEILAQKEPVEEKEQDRLLDEMENARMREDKIRRTFEKSSTGTYYRTAKLQMANIEKSSIKPKMDIKAPAKTIAKKPAALKAGKTPAKKTAVIAARKTFVKTTKPKTISIAIQKPKVVLKSAGSKPAQHQQEERHAPSPKPERAVVSLSHMLSAHMEKIRLQEERINALKEQKAGLLVEHLEPIERKLQAEIETVSDKLLEKQKIILELEQKATCIPEIVEGIDQRNAKVSEVESEARSALDNARIELEEILSELEGIRAVSEERISDVEKNVAVANAKLDSVKKTHNNISSLMESADEMLNSTKAAIEEQIVKMEEIEATMASLEDYKANLESDMEAATKTIDRQKNLAKIMSEHSHTISAVDTWTRSQFEEYEKQVEELTELTASNERDFAQLRESVETSFVRRYVSELSGILKRHEFEIGKTLEAEKSIDVRVEDEKEKLRSLISQGHEMTSILMDKKMHNGISQKNMESMMHSKQAKIESIGAHIRNREHVSQAARNALARLEKEGKE